jgi:hypothetical protein
VCRVTDHSSVCAFQGLQHTPLLQRNNALECNTLRLSAAHLMTFNQPRVAIQSEPVYIDIHYIYICLQMACNLLLTFIIVSLKCFLRRISFSSSSYLLVLALPSPPLLPHELPLLPQLSLPHHPAPTTRPWPRYPITLMPSASSPNYRLSCTLI